MIHCKKTPLVRHAHYWKWFTGSLFAYSWAAYCRRTAQCCLLFHLSAWSIAPSAVSVSSILAGMWYPLRVPFKRHWLIWKWPSDAHESLLLLLLRLWSSGVSKSAPSSTVRDAPSYVVLLFTTRIQSWRELSCLLSFHHLALLSIPFAFHACHLTLWFAIVSLGPLHHHRHSSQRTLCTHHCR